MTTDPVKLERIKAAMVGYFQRCPVGVSFANLQDAVGDADALGDQILFAPNFSRLNICLWPCVSPEFGEAITELLQSGLITMYPTDVWRYMVDGKRYPSMPLARGIDPSVPFLHLHWVPVAFDLTRVS